MAHGESPLLARPSSEDSSTRGTEEEEALLTGQPIQRPSENKRTWREIGLFVWALVATVVVIILAVIYQHESTTKHAQPKSGGWGPNGKPSGKRNMIFMVSDGMGPTSLSLTRSYRQYTTGLPIDNVLVLDDHLIGSSRTRSTSSLITDSAAGATAFSCGLKSYNGAISVLPNHTPCGTVMEAAKKAGYMTGLVVTTRITDATPACFASHANRREYEDLIAEQLIGHYPLGRTVDLILGADDKDVVKMAQKSGYHYIDSRGQFDNLVDGGEVKLPLLGLIASHDVPYEIDRVHVADVYPSQEEMTRLALKTLSAATKDSEKGFFIMIEGSRIDHAGHANDPAAQVHEVLAHDAAFAAVLEFLEQDDTAGILVSTSDHETGGLATAKQLSHAYPQYRWFPGVLANATHSTEWMARVWGSYLADVGATVGRKEKTKFLTSILQTGQGIVDASQEEIDAILDAASDWPPYYLFAIMISRRAQVGWSTHGHSAVDVNIYASSPAHAPPLVGNHENTDVGKFITEYLDLDLESITQELKRKNVKQGPFGGADDEVWGDWMGPEGLPINDNGQLVSLDTYHGDFKHRKREAEVEGCGCGLKH